MYYRVNLFAREQLISTELLHDCRLDRAKSYAVHKVKSEGADGAEVQKPDGSIVFRTPRSLRRA